MTDPKGVSELEVLRDGEKVARLLRVQDGCRFLYDSDYLASGGGPIARNLPVAGLEVHGTTNLPSFFAGLLPEGVMQSAILRTHRLSADDLFSQLAVAGSDAVGDVTVHVPNSPAGKPVRTVKDAVRILTDLQDRLILPVSPSISGVQPKISIGSSMGASRGPLAIVKIAAPDYPGILENEAFFMKLAPTAGLKAARVELKDGGLMIERFDRVRRRGQPTAQLHVEDVLQIQNRYPLAKYSMDYCEILDTAVDLKVAKPVLLGLLRLYAYSYAIINGDLHAKNVSFFHSRELGRWTMTPAYDLVCTLPFFPDHPFGRNMILGLNEQVGAFTATDFRRIGKKYGLVESAVDRMLGQICAGVQQGMPAIYREFPESIQEEIMQRARQISP